MMQHQLISHPASLIHSQEEVFVRLVNRIMVGIFLLMIFDGSLRKWVLPSLSSPLILVKDAVVVWLYLLVFRAKKWPHHAMANVGYLLALIFLGLMVLQLFNERLPLVNIFFGYRNYFLLLPLAFIMREYMGWEDIKRLARIGCLIAIPSAALVLIQVNSPVDAFINRSVGGDDDQVIFYVVAGVVRPYGFFSFTNGQAYFSIMALAMVCMNFLLATQDRFLKNWLAWVAALAVLINIVTSGSRATFGMTIIMMGALALGGITIIHTKEGFRIVLALILALFATGFLASFLFSDNLEHMQERVETASSQEGGTMNRVIRDNFILLDDIPENLPLLGGGLGMGSAAAWRSMGNVTGLYLESEWVRVIYESGILLGFAFMFYRLWLGFGTLFQAIRILRLAKTPIPLLMILAILQTVISGQMSFNNTSLYFGWFLLGLAMATNEAYKKSLLASETTRQ
ncbi:MAG: hypothetical protein AAFR61_03775 [Bacteroidota bacterium]